jgi:Na+/H+-translocating membrane pyrophosphatase
MVLFAVAIICLAEQNFGEFYTVVAFIVGALTSIGSGFIGMKIAVSANLQTTKESA